MKIKPSISDYSIFLSKTNTRQQGTLLHASAKSTYLSEDCPKADCPKVGLPNPAVLVGWPKPEMDDWPKGLAEVAAGCVAVEEGVTPKREPAGAFPKTLLAVPKAALAVVPPEPLIIELLEDTVAWPKRLGPAGVTWLKSPGAGLVVVLLPKRSLLEVGVDCPNRPVDVVTELRVLKSSDTNGDEEVVDDGCPKTVLTDVDAGGENASPDVAAVVVATVAVVVLLVAAAATVSVVEDSPDNECSKPSLFAGMDDKRREPRVEVDVAGAVAGGTGDRPDDDAAVPAAIDGLLFEEENAGGVGDMVEVVVAAAADAVGGLKSKLEFVEDVGGTVKRLAIEEEAVVVDEAWEDWKRPVTGDGATVVDETCDDWKRPLGGVVVDPKTVGGVEVGVLNITEVANDELPVWFDASERLVFGVNKNVTLGLWTSVVAVEVAVVVVVPVVMTVWSTELTVAKVEAGGAGSVSGWVDETTLGGLSLADDTIGWGSLLGEAAGWTGSAGLEAVSIEKLKPVVEAGAVVKRFLDTPKEEVVVTDVESRPNQGDETGASSWVLEVSDEAEVEVKFEDGSVPKTLVLAKGVVERGEEDATFDVSEGILTAENWKLVLAPVPKEKLVVLESVDLNVGTDEVITGGTVPGKKWKNKK